MDYGVIKTFNNDGGKLTITATDYGIDLLQTSEDGEAIIAVDIKNIEALIEALQSTVIEGDFWDLTERLKESGFAVEVCD